VVEGPADPAAGVCCPRLKCVPTPQAQVVGNGVARAAGDGSSQFSGNSNVSGAMPGYGIALCVIGAVVMLLLVIVSVSLVKFLRSN